MPDTMSMIEQMARAMALADDEDYMEDRHRYNRRAEAALDAMRRPSVPMMQAMRRHANILMPTPAVFWQVALDAAQEVG